LTLTEVLKVNQVSIDRVDVSLFVFSFYNYLSEHLLDEKI